MKIATLSVVAVIVGLGIYANLPEGGEDRSLVEDEPAVSKVEEKEVKPKVKWPSNVVEDIAAIDEIVTDKPEEGEFSKIYSSQRLIGVFSIDIENEKVNGSLSYKFNQDGTFAHHRTMSFPESYDLKASGTYYIDGNALTLTFSDLRDVERIEDQAMFTIIDSGNAIQSGKVVISKS